MRRLIQSRLTHTFNIRAGKTGNVHRVDDFASLLIQSITESTVQRHIVDMNIHLQIDLCPGIPEPSFSRGWKITQLPRRLQIEHNLMHRTGSVWHRSLTERRTDVGNRVSKLMKQNRRTFGFAGHTGRQPLSRRKLPKHHIAADLTNRLKMIEKLL